MLKRPEEHPMKAKLKSARITQQEVAFNIGCSQGFLSSILNGYRPAPSWVAAKLHEIEIIIKNCPTH